MSPLHFSTPHSIIDSSFFQRLSELKLNDYKLDTSSKPVIGSISYTTVSKEQSSYLSLTDASFGLKATFKDTLPAKSAFVLDGLLYNQNTIEEFKQLNKSDFLKQQAQAIYDAIKDGSLFTDPGLLNRFAVLSFSDLKKYKFYYWVNFPQLHSKWDLIDSELVDDDKYDDFVIDNQVFVITDSSKALTCPLSEISSTTNDDSLFVGFASTSTTKDPSWELRNILTLLAIKGFNNVKVLVFNSGKPYQVLHLKLVDKVEGFPKTTGWERTNEGKLGAKVTDLGSLIDPVQLADEAVNLNLKLMKWRISPELDLSIVKDTKCLLLGAGTLGSYVARALLGWGVQNITLVDNGKVSFSNPVRQPLFKFDDCLHGGAPKAQAAAASLKEIYPSVNLKGIELEVPMAGHPVYNEKKQSKDYDRLVELIDQHDLVFLLMDSRETRWFPTVVANAKRKIVINAALGFDSYLVMRHGCVGDSGLGRLGCYFCNDVFAPSDSLTDRTLDQMCTVTRPGVALVASGLAVELLVSVLQHPLKQYAPASSESKSETASILGAVPHQIRGFLHNFNNIKVETPNYQYCSACSDPVIEAFNSGGWDFVKSVLEDSKILENLTGLAEVQREAEELDLDFDITDDEDDFE